MRRYLVEVTDGDSGHGWRIVDSLDDPIRAGAMAQRMFDRNEYCSCGGVRVTEQRVVFEPMMRS